MAMPHPTLRLIVPQWASTLLLLIVLLGAGASLSGLRLALEARRMAEASGPVAALPVRVALGREVFVVPADLVRFPAGVAAEAARSGTVETERLELAIDWRRLPGFDEAPGSPRLHLALVAGDDPVPAATRLERIYRPFFEGEEIAGPDGLAGHRLAAASGYGGETLFYEPDTPETGKMPFMIRCGSETSSLAPALCFRRVALSANLRLEYRYRRDQLDRWRGIDAAVTTLIARIRG